MLQAVCARDCTEEGRERGQFAACCFPSLSLSSLSERGGACSSSLLSWLSENESLIQCPILIRDGRANALGSCSRAQARATKVTNFGRVGFLEAGPSHNRSVPLSLALSPPRAELFCNCGHHFRRGRVAARPAEMAAASRIDSIAARSRPSLHPDAPLPGANTLAVVRLGAEKRAEASPWRHFFGALEDREPGQGSPQTFSGP